MGKKRMQKLKNKFMELTRNLASHRTESIRALIRQNNNDEDIPDGYEEQVNDHMEPLTPNTFNIQNEPHVQRDDDLTFLPELLGVAPHSSQTPFSSENQPDNLEQTVTSLIQTSVHQHIPKPPVDLDKNLQRHLVHVQETVVGELQRLGPLFHRKGLMGYLTDCYHRQIFQQLTGVLPQIRSSKSCFVLLQWLLQTYLSQDLLGHADFKEMDLIRKIDLMLLSECVTATQKILLDFVKKEVSMTLDNILSTESQLRGSKSEEYLNETYIDTIQCINAMPCEALKISSRLSVQIQDICLEELLVFVRRYISEQTEILEKSKMTSVETFDLFKTLKTCRELKHYVQTTQVKYDLRMEMVESLEKMQDFTKTRLLESVADFTELHLKNYFRADKKQFLLIGALRELFPNLSSCSDERKSVMDDVYKLTVHLYLKHLISNSQKKLTKCWSSNIGETVTEDAELIHDTFSDLAPGVQRWNFTLLEISDILKYHDDTLKLIVGVMENKCIDKGCTDDLALLPALLQWKGLSRWEVRNIMEALPDKEPTTRPTLWSCFPFG